MENGVGDTEAKSLSIEAEIAQILDGAMKRVEWKNRVSLLCLMLAAPLLLASGYPFLKSMLIQYFLFWSGGMLLSIAMYAYQPRLPRRVVKQVPLAASRAKLRRVK